MFYIFFNRRRKRLAEAIIDIYVQLNIIETSEKDQEQKIAAELEHLAGRIGSEIIIPIIRFGYKSSARIEIYNVRFDVWTAHRLVLIKIFRLAYAVKIGQKVADILEQATFNF